MKKVCSPESVRPQSHDSDNGRNTIITGGSGEGATISNKRGVRGATPNKFLKKALIVVLSLSVFFSLFAISASATIVNSDITDVYKSTFGYTITAGLVDSADDSMIYNYYHYDDFLYTNSNNFLNDGVFNGSVIVDNNSMNDYTYENDFSTDFYMSNCSVKFNPFYFSDGSNFIDIIDNFWYDACLLFDTDYTVFSGAYIKLDVQVRDVVDGGQYFSLNMPIGTYLESNLITIPLVDDDGYIYLSNVFSYALGYGGIPYFDKEYPAIVDFTVTLIDGEIRYGESILLTGIPDDCSNGDIDEYSMALFNYGNDYGFSAGQEQGFDLGYIAGYDDAYNLGYNAGQSSQFPATGIGEFLGESVGGFLSRDLIGSVSIGDILLAVIGIVIVLCFLKFFAGG